ncbi:MAG: amino acid adenylation domain-containing protein [Haliea sp.]
MKNNAYRHSGGWIENNSPFQKDLTVPAVFGAHVAQKPNAAALVLPASGDTPARKMTYAELAEQADGVAQALIARGVKPGDYVAFAVSRNFDVVIAMLGILKAGGAYVPLDLAYPEQRLKFMLQDAGIKVVVTSKGMASSLPRQDLQIIEVGETVEKKDNLPEIGALDPAYVIYTSGSTGQPKGVVTPHRAILRLVTGATYTKFGPDRRVLQMAPVSFDAATFEIWGPLLNGGTCVIYPAAGLPDLNRLRTVLKDTNINTLWLTSSLFNVVVDQDVHILDGIEELLVGGEALSPAHVRKALENLDANLVNGYGPTETTTFACCYRIPRDLPKNLPSLPIGRPIENTAIAVLDENFEPVPEGEIGELCIAGDGLAIGYLNRPDITKERFIEDDTVPGNRFYRTGDLVRLLPSGDIEFIGRRDTQVKIAGHRIELGEIEHALRDHEKLQDAAVEVDTAVENAQRIAAWIVPKDCKDVPSTNELRTFLEDKLPRYMVPAVFTTLEKLPLTTNGKLDRSALFIVKAARPILEQAYAAPRGEMETFIANCWAELLDLDKVGRKDRFFELGGTSLLAMRFLKICHSERNFRLSVAEFFDGPTVENITAIADKRNAEVAEVSEPVRQQNTDNRIAIVGMAGRFAGAANVTNFWDMLLEGRSGRVEITRDDLEAAGEDPALLDDPDYVAAAFPLDETESFDAAFFGFNPREVQLMDPQQRIMLECAWTALEDAGYDPKQASDRVGVFGGVGRNAYLLHNLMSHEALRETAAEYNMLIGNERDFPCTHIAYRLGLRGPAVTVQTACSTSGVAIHMAADNLLRGECDLALAGGAKILVPNRVGYRYVEGGPLAPDGVIRAFDAEAKGMVRGSGAAMVAMKRLDDALADGDHIYAVLLGSAVNNDGGAGAGFTAPSVSGQSAVIAEAHRNAGVTADSISLIEAHGTGTILGDPIEVEALTRAFRTTSEERGFCALGSVKTNIGHLDAGATAAGLIKAALALENGIIPPSLNYTQANPQIDFEHSPFYVASKPVEWKRNEKPRRAGISSFGLGGTNAHLIIEEAPERPASDPAQGSQLLVLSARTKSALEKRCDDLADWLERHENANLADVAHTLLIGRRRFEKRLALICATREEAIEKLRRRDPREILRAGMAADKPPVAFMFPGGGAQYVGMAREHYHNSPEFRRAMDEVSAHYQQRTGQSLIDIIYNADGNLDAPAIALPSLFAIEYAMAQLWKSWGIEPSSMIGHSMGEYTAACLAGVFSMEEALDIVLCRGRLFETLDGGSMLSVPLSEEALRERLGGELSIAAINRNDQCVVSGPVAAIEALGEALTKEGAETRRVHINVAAHSTMVEPILDEFRNELKNIKFNAPALRFASNLTGDWITKEEATDPEYWVRHLRSTVRFLGGMAKLFEDSEGIIMEMGPGQTLSTLARQHPARGAGHEVIATLRHPQEDVLDEDFLLGAAGRFWLSGGDLNWNLFIGGSRQRVVLPTYPFERTLYWIDAVPYTSGGYSSDPTVAFSQNAEETGLDSEEIGEPATRKERILIQLKMIIQQLSGLPVERVDEHATFLELGFDSLFLTQANAAFRKKFKIKLTTRQLMETTPVLDLLAEHLDQNLPEDAKFDEVPAPTARDAGATGVPATAASAHRGQMAAEINPGDNPGRPTIKKVSSDELTPEQERHIDELVATTTARTPKAKEATQASRSVLADPRTVQGFRSRWKEMVYPLLSDRAKGSKVWDVDGNEYIDLVGGYGVTMFGHGPQFVIDAVREQLGKTLAIGPQSVLAGEVARLVSDMTGMERVAFCNTGSEAVLAAVRMARTVTGKSKIAKFDGHYHGIFDEMQVRGAGTGSRRTTLPSAPGIPTEAIQNTIILQYGDPEAFEVIRENVDDLALVLVEPIRSRNPDYQPKEYLKELRKVTEELGVPLLFDEIVTGFRSHPGGVQALFGIRADIATYGKIIGGGLPIGIVTGSALYMDTLDGGFWKFGDDSVPTSDMTWFAGTFVRHPLALAATKASLEHLKKEGPALQENLNARSAALSARLNKFFKRVNTPLKCEQFASVLRIAFTKHQEYSDLLFFHLRNRGIMTYEGRPAFLTTAHSDEDLDKVYSAFVECVTLLIDVGLIEGYDPTITRRIPLTTGQQEIWVSAQFSQDASCSYNLCSTLTLTGDLKENLLQAALNDLAARHEALRATPESDGFHQIIRPEIEVPLAVDDFRGQDDKTQQERIAKAKQAQVTTPFDLQRGPLVRSHMMRLSDNRYLVLLTVHHLIADGWSCGVLLRDLGELYAARKEDRAPNLAPAQQLSEFVSFLSQPDQRETRNEARDYWLKLYEGELPKVQLPSDRPRPNKRNYSSQRFELPMPSEVVANLRTIARNNGTTLFASLIGGFATYLSRLTGMTDTPIGFSAAGQPLLGGQDLVGHCVNFLPLRLSTDLHGGFGAHLKNIGGTVLDALENQNFDFLAFVQELQPERDASWAPLVSIGVNLDPSSKGIKFADFEVKAGSVGRAFEHLDLFLNFVETGSDVELQCTFNKALYDERTMRKRMAEYVSLLSQAAANPETPLSDLALLSDEDRDKLISGWNQTARDYPRGESIADIFRERAKSHADKTALQVPDPQAPETILQTVSYSDLDRRSDEWAARLQQAGVKQGDFVMLLLPRSPDLIVGILATLKVGAAYVPIEPDTPASRRDFTLEDSVATAVLTLGTLVEEASLCGVPALKMDQTTEPVDLSGFTVPVMTGEDTAYMMYTSGSTGVPKGVVIPHRAIGRLVINNDFTPLDDSRVLVHLAPASFDAATFEIWGALLNGAKLILPEGNGLPELSQLGSILKLNGVTTLWLTAALFNTIIDEDPELLSGVQEILTGGEALSVPHVSHAIATLPGTTFINGYGPTENTTFSCCYRIPTDFDAKSASVPIGRPIANTRAYIVDPDGQPVPIGIPGELLVGGDGLALGYWKRDELTAAAFIPDRLLDSDDSNGRLYRTGDFCRYMPDGNIEFLGRRDDQVKIRGFRIEPGEVEAALLDIEDVQKSSVLFQAIGDSGRLIAFVTPNNEGTNEGRLLRILRDRLPRHLVPSRIIALAQLPVSENGKVDRQALMQISIDEAEAVENVAPETKTEKALAAIWCDILQRPEVSAVESFFNLGGHSLMAVRLFDRIRRNFGADLPISTLFSHPTIRDLSEIVDEKLESPEVSPAKNMKASEEEWDTSIVIHPGPGNGAHALFIVGGVGGNVNNLFDLGNALGDHRSVIGLQMRGILGHTPRGSLEEMASENIRYMQRHQPHGPYYLAGYSAGAQTAFEMARQLTAKGEHVSELIILDTYAPGFAPVDMFSIPVKLPLRQFLKNEVQLIKNYGLPHFYLRLRAKFIRQFIRGRALDLVEKVNLTFARQIRTGRAWFVAAKDYKGGPYSGHVSLVLSRPDDMREEVLISKHPLLGWDKFVDREITRYVIDARHLDMVTGEHAVTLAQFIEERLNAGKAPF